MNEVTSVTAEIRKEKFCPLQSECPNYFPKFAEQVEKGYFCQSCRDLITCDFFINGVEPYAFEYCAIRDMQCKDTREASIAVIAMERGIQI